MLFHQKEEFRPFTLQHLPKLFISDFTFDSNNTLWLATDKGLIHYIDGNSFKIYNSTNTNLPNNYIQTIDVDKENRLWIMYGNGGIAMREHETHFTIYDEVKYSATGIFLPDAVFVVTDKNKVVWTFTNKGELFKLEGQTGSFEKVNVLGCQYPDIYVTALQTGKSGNVWIGYIKGVTIGVARQEQNGLFTAYPIGRNRQVKHLLVPDENELIHEIQFDNSGNVWIGGSGGIIKVNVSVKTQ